MAEQSVPKDPREPPVEPPVEHKHHHFVSHPTSHYYRANTLTSVGAELTETSHKTDDTIIRTVTVKAKNIHPPHTHHKTDLIESSVNFLIAAGLGLAVSIYCSSSPPADVSVGTLYYDTNLGNLLSYDGQSWHVIVLHPQKEEARRHFGDGYQGTLYFDIERIKLFFHDGKMWYLIQMMSDKRFEAFEQVAKEAEVAKDA
jgi:hypothetical protein